MGRGVREREVIIGERSRGGDEKEGGGGKSKLGGVIRERREDKGGRGIRLGREGGKEREKRKGVREGGKRVKE